MNTFLRHFPLSNCLCTLYQLLIHGGKGKKDHTTLRRSGVYHEGFRGHRNSKTTEIYTHVNSYALDKIQAHLTTYNLFLY